MLLSCRSVLSKLLEIDLYFQVIQICLLQSTRFTAEFQKTRNLLVFIAGINVALWIQDTLILDNLRLSITDLKNEFDFFGPYG